MYLMTRQYYIHFTLKHRAVIVLSTCISVSCTNYARIGSKRAKTYHIYRCIILFPRLSWSKKATYPVSFIGEVSHQWRKMPGSCNNIQQVGYYLLGLKKFVALFTYVRYFILPHFLSMFFVYGPWFTVYQYKEDPLVEMG